MSLISILLIGLGLAMDAFAVSLTVGMNTSKKEKLNMALKASIFFGGFQGLMPLIGWSIGINFAEYIEKIDHWVAFILLVLIGGKMIFESIKDEDKSEKADKGYSNKRFLILAIATSIDALAVGVSFAFLNVDIVNAISIIAIITFITCIIGVYVGEALCKILGSKAEIIGGAILIIIGIKILIDHSFM